MIRAVAIALTVASVSFAGPKDDISKPIKTVVNAVRYGKDLAALKLFAGEEQGKALLGEDWVKGTDAQRKEFVDLFLQLFGKIAFPKIRKNFENLDTVLYDEPTVNKDGTAEIASTILINHPLKKQELKVKYAVVKQGSGFKVVDVSVIGDSMIKGIREEQIVPIMKDGGWDGLLKLMREKNASMKDVILK
jgi:phospholipid transport system substrate-binding protein